MDVFEPLLSGSAPVSGAPAMAEWTRTGTADDTLATTGYQLSDFTGYDFGKDTRFTVFGQTVAGNGTYLDADIQRLDGDLAAITLDDGLPEWSASMVWPGNNDGYGRAVMVNTADAWWVGPDHATGGD